MSKIKGRIWAAAYVRAMIWSKPEPERPKKKKKLIRLSYKF